MDAVRRESNAFKCLAASGVAAVHVLRSGQEHMAQAFFNPTVAVGDTINGGAFAPRTTSAPILPNTPAHVECHVRQIVDSGGDHAIAIMEVVEAEFREEFRPLTIGESPWQLGASFPLWPSRARPGES